MSWRNLIPRNAAMISSELFIGIVAAVAPGFSPGEKPRPHYVVLDFDPPALSPIVSGTTTIALTTLSESQRFPRDDRILRAVFPDGPVSGPASRDRSGRLSVSGGMRRRPQDDRCS